MKSHVFHPDAEEEYTEAARYYAGLEAELGRRFYDEVERLIRELRAQPMRFWMFDPSVVRRHLSTVFPYVVVCLEQPDRISIAAVTHCKRRPGYWRSGGMAGWLECSASTRPCLAVGRA